MRKSIKLIPILNNEITIITGIIYSDKVLKDTFSINNIVSRQLNSVSAFKIIYEDKTVGFINLVYNEKSKQIEVDIGIKEPFTNQGIGTEALKLLRNYCLQTNMLNIIAQIKYDNMIGEKALEHSGFIKTKDDKEFKYYKIKKDVKNENSN